MDETFGSKYFWFRKWIFYLVFQLQLIGWPLWNFFGLQVHDWEAAFEVGYCYIHSSKSYHNFSSELYIKKKKTFSTFYLTVYEMNLYTYHSHSCVLISFGLWYFTLPNSSNDWWQPNLVAVWCLNSENACGTRLSSLTPCFIFSFYGNWFISKFLLCLWLEKDTYSNRCTHVLLWWNLELIRHAALLSTLAAIFVIF